MAVRQACRLHREAPAAPPSPTPPRPSPHTRRASPCSQLHPLLFVERPRPRHCWENSAWIILRNPSPATGRGSATATTITPTLQLKTLRGG